MSTAPPISQAEFAAIEARIDRRFGAGAFHLLLELITMIIDDRDWKDPDDR